MTETSMLTHDELRTCLREVLSESSQGKISITDAQVDVPLKNLGMDSVVLLSFLVAVEDFLGFEWSADVPQTVFASVDSMASYIESRS